MPGVYIVSKISPYDRTMRMYYIQINEFLVIEDKNFFLNYKTCVYAWNKVTHIKGLITICFYILCH